jgi:hypothetical protein
MLMRTSNALTLIAGVAAVALASLVVASPAAGATLPLGQKITMIDQYADPGDGQGQYYTVNPADAKITPYGVVTNQHTTGVDVDDAGLGWAIGQVGRTLTPTLWKADATTATLTSPVTITLAGGGVIDACNGIDLAKDGRVLIACVQDDGGDAAPISHVGYVDAAGLFTPVASWSLQEFQIFFSLALDPVTGVLWGFGPFDGPYSYTIDLADESYERIAPIGQNAYGADFDRDGKLFVTTDILIVESYYPALGLLNPSTGVYVERQRYLSTVTGESPVWSNSITVWGALAATGSTGTEMLPIGLGSALLLLAGAAFVATSRMSRRTT